MKRSLLLISFFMASLSQAALHTSMVPYQQGKAPLEGYLVYDDAFTGKRPGVLVVHEWMGLDENTKKHADQLAQLGYVAFAVDIYGKGQIPADVTAAAKISTVFKTERNLLRARVLSGLKILQSQPLVESKKMAAIGYCFGGTTVLELARSGADILGVVSFHGGLSSPTPEDAKNIKAKVLVLHGADDSYVPAAEVAAFEDEMRNAKVDWQLVKYSNAVHGFTHAGAGTDNSKGYAYNEKADRRSWEAMKSFFNELFTSKS